jgi:hypothetical protein
VATIPAKLLAAVSPGKLAQEQGERWLRFTLIDKETGREGPAIFGGYERRQGTLVFVPRYPLVHGQRYRATLDWGRGETASTEYEVPPRPPTPPAVVEKVYPTAAALPANNLKFYLYFSRAMRETSAVFDQIQILDPDGKPVPDPWRRTELWTPDGRRLTLWVHPGRVKRGVNLREEFAPVLQPGQEYTLLIPAEMLDADGQALGKAVTKKFRTTAEDRTRPLPEQWKVRAPAAGTKEPLVLEFPKPLDHALLQRYVKVADARGKPVLGRIEVGGEERSWAFHPNQPWQADGYTVHVDERLEDLAGNTPLRLFDVDLEEPQPKPPQLTLAFRPR